ncbi:MAG: hypothetical protein OEO20_05020 [Gemmatimonadota bacterium]|nr:hypothetical protein [Gemmatimonadota bacterium]MDH3366907.1 hypothetical protein [Gemmatimonadota bacterium]MDH3477646.1 hypothetical protein [Gemmatimonadota bacterium]MDH3568561.1 hypothetical protein [Gemmatimonadota bacterium]MDH5549903.1 hypothetical protein [Gemmatimonadota bacterium]
MKRLLLALVVVVLIALDWAAVRDILRGESDLRNEFLTVVMSGLAFGGLIGYWVRERRKRRGHDGPTTRQGY